MDAEIARWRMHNQHITLPHARSVTGVMQRLLGVQAENPSQSAWAVATRTQDPDQADLAALLDSGEVIRTHVLRPTWHYVARDDADWLLALTGPRVHRTTGPALTRTHGFTDDDRARLTDAVLELLTDHPDRTRDEVAAHLRAHLPALAERLTGQAVMILLAHVELDRWVCSGKPRSGEHTYARWTDRVGERVTTVDFDRDAALAQLALRYFTGHGPATVADLVYWATLTLTEARRGLEAVQDQLESFQHDGRTFWHSPGRPDPAPADDPAGHLLQVLDELYRGYQDSRWVLDAGGIVPRGRESAIGMAVIDGQLVASMKRRTNPTTVTFELTPYRELTQRDRDALESAAVRYGRFLGLDAQIRTD